MWPHLINISVISNECDMILFTNFGLVQFLVELQKTNDISSGPHALPNPSNLEVFGKYAHPPKFLKICLFFGKILFLPMMFPQHYHKIIQCIICNGEENREYHDD